MTEKEMIADMQKVIEYTCNVYDEKGNHIRNKCNSWDCEYFCATNGVCCSYGKKEAIALYNAGYRKIPEGSVVLSKEEHQKYCAYKIIEPQIKGCLDRERKLEKQVKELEEQRDRQAYIAEELIQEKHRWTEQARKEMAGIIIHDLEVKVAQYAMVLDLPELPEKLRFIPTEVMVHFVKTLKEQVGVEVEE